MLLRDCGLPVFPTELMNFFDLQVNGYGGVDFNGDDLDAAELDRVCERLDAQGVAGILATVITDSIPVMEARVQRLARLLQQAHWARKIVRGIHIEGPFINPSEGYRGAHPVDAITPADESAMKRLLDAADGLLRLVTLAPEFDRDMKVIRLLADSRITVSAGHTNASLDCLKAAIDAGLTMFTHLGNGCPATMPRHDNIVQRVLTLREKLWLCFIADGDHIPFFTLKNYLDLVGVKKTIVVTDAIIAADMPPGQYSFGRWKLDIGEDMVARSPDNRHLVGSTVTMEKSFRNLTQHLGFSSADARQMLETNPLTAVPMSS
jgi:N-acetylglucosamine-6-phosphate deacetylase